MKTFIPRLSTLATASVIAAFSILPVSVSAEAQRSGRRGGQSSGGAQPRSGGGERTGTAAPRSDGGAKSGTATGRTGSTPTAAATADGDGAKTGQGASTGRRSSKDQPDGQAVRRRAEGRPGGGTTVIVPGGYYGGYLPWGYAGLGLAGYYGGYYDGYGYGYPQYSASSGEEGSLRLKVKPKDASVFVDGYLAGQVDDFDGVFQRLHVEPGPHRIEISADGYETLTFEIRAERDRTITYTGALTRMP